MVIRLPNKPGRFVLDGIEVQIFPDEILIEVNKLGPATAVPAQSPGIAAKEFDPINNPPPLSQSLPGAIRTIRKIVKDYKEGK